VAKIAPTHYETFIKTVNELYQGIDFTHNKHTIHLSPTILSPYDLISGVKEQKSDCEKYLVSLPQTFRNTAKSELYRSESGWINRGVSERKIVAFSIDKTHKIAPVLNPQKAVGIDSSKNIIAICCYDNQTSGYHYLENILNMPKSKTNNEYHWNKLNNQNKKTITNNLEILVSIACERMMIIDTNLINSNNHLTKNQLTGMIEGCFSGYENDPDQNGEFRTKLRESLFNLTNNVQCHCDPDFQTIKPPDIVRTLVQTLSKKDGRIQQFTPLYTNLRSHESQPIQITDLIAGCIRTNLYSSEPPLSLNRLYFNEKHLTTADKRKKLYVKAYHWERKVV
jgi:hypothetical protein